MEIVKESISTGNQKPTYFWGIYYFVFYTLGYVVYSVHTTFQAGANIDPKNFVYLFTPGLFFPIVVLIVAAVLSFKAMGENFSRLVLITLAGTFVVTVYRSLSYWFFFANLEKILLIFFLLFLASFAGYILQIFLIRKPLFAKILAGLLLATTTITLVTYVSYTKRQITMDYCGNLGTQDDRLNCYYIFGVTNLNLDACLEVPTAKRFPAGPECVSLVLNKLQSAGQLNANICMGLHNQEAKSVCNYQLAVTLHDVNMCTNIVDVYTDENMAIREMDQSTMLPVMNGKVAVPNKQNCLSIFNKQ